MVLLLAPRDCVVDFASALRYLHHGCHARDYRHAGRQSDEQRRCHFACFLEEEARPQMRRWRADGWITCWLPKNSLPKEDLAKDWQAKDSPAKNGLRKRFLPAQASLLYSCFSIFAGGSVQGGNDVLANELIRESHLLVIGDNEPNYHASHPSSAVTDIAFCAFNE